MLNKGRMRRDIYFTLDMDISVCGGQVHFKDDSALL